MSPSAVGVNTTHPDRQDNADVQKGLGRLIKPYVVGRPVDGQQKNPKLQHKIKFSFVGCQA